MNWLKQIFSVLCQQNEDYLDLIHTAADGTSEGTSFAHDNTYYSGEGAFIYPWLWTGVYAGTEMIRLLRKAKIDYREPGSTNVTAPFAFRLSALP